MNTKIMKMKVFLLINLLAVVGEGCAHRSQILSTPVVSMTETSSNEKIDKLQELGPVTSQYCMGDDPVSTDKSSGDIGLMDEVITKAQKEKNARYIKNATFFSQGRCVILEGIALK